MDIIFLLFLTELEKKFLLEIAWNLRVLYDGMITWI